MTGLSAQRLTTCPTGQVRNTFLRSVENFINDSVQIYTVDPPSIWPPFLRWHLNRLFFPSKETLATSDRESETTTDTEGEGTGGPNGKTRNQLLTWTQSDSRTVVEKAIWAIGPCGSIQEIVYIYIIYMYNIYRYIYFVYRKGNSIIYIQREPLYNYKFP